MAGERAIGRNDPCPCGSGKKYKRCCMAADEAARAAPPDDEDLLDLATDEPVEVAQSWYDVDDEDAAREVLGRMKGARPDGDGWVLTGYVDGAEGVPFAWVRPGEEQIHVVAPNGALLMSARGFIEAYADRRVLQHTRSSISDVEVTLDWVRRPDGEGGEPEETPASLAEARELLQTTLRSYYERWIHCGNRALDGRSPLQVAKSGKGPRLELLYGILTLLDQREAAAPWSEDLPYDFGEVWRMLGIDRATVMGERASPTGSS